MAEEDLSNPATDPNEYVTDGKGNYWAWAQGTSMASPHAVGVAALVVAEYGARDPEHPPPLNPAQYTARCDGTPERNGFYGDGIVNAAAVGADER